MKLNTNPAAQAVKSHNDHIIELLTKEASDWIKSIIVANNINAAEMMRIGQVIDEYREALDKHLVK